MYGDDQAQFTFEGSVKITMIAKETGKNVTLHVNKLNITEESIRFGRTDGQQAPLYKGRSPFLFICNIIYIDAAFWEKELFYPFVAKANNEGSYVSEFSLPT